jgi:hypothetical protein
VRLVVWRRSGSRLLLHGGSGNLEQQAAELGGGRGGQAVTQVRPWLGLGLLPLPPPQLKCLISLLPDWCMLPAPKQALLSTGGPGPCAAALSRLYTSLNDFCM